MNDYEKQGLYVHIPFCKKKCRYCSFYSITSSFSPSSYLDSLFIHFCYLKDRFSFSPVFSTLYFGGGTPSLLDLNFFEEFFVKLNKNADISDLKEVTLEVNPETVNPHYFKGLKGIGINRISIGVQSFDDNILKVMGRIHNSNTAKKSVEQALNEFENVSIDLIIGVKGQEGKRAEEFFDFSLLNGVKHVSVYMLEGEKNRGIAMDDDITANIYTDIVQFLKENGFFQYEISNFSKKGFESKHNKLYWHGNNYLGIGTMAHSFILNEKRLNGIRFYDNTDYFTFINRKFLIGEQRIEYEDLVAEMFMLMLRMNAGVDVSVFEERFGINPIDYFSEILNEFRGYFIMDSRSVRLNLNGMLISNEIFEKILFFNGKIRKKEKDG